MHMWLHTQASIIVVIVPRSSGDGLYAAFGPFLSPSENFLEPGKFF